jgi:hypothetical protein
MRRFSQIEFGILLLAAAMIVGGCIMIFYPKDMVVSHQAYRWVRSSSEHISKSASPFYGVVSVIFGLGLGFLVFNGRRKK